MPAGEAGRGFLPDSHPDRLRWNARYAGGFTPSFAPHPLAVRALALELPPGPVADLACGPSGSALLAAANGRPVTAVDISEIALGMLRDQARRQDLDALITPVHADLAAWHPRLRSYALVLCTCFWDPDVFAAAAEAVADGAVLGWEAFTLAALRTRPRLCPDWCLGDDEPASLLPAGFTVLDQHDLADREKGDRRQMLACRVGLT
jgi:SAM-dependent methyltransferase